MLGFGFIVGLFVCVSQPQVLPDMDTVAEGYYFISSHAHIALPSQISKRANKKSRESLVFLRLGFSGIYASLSKYTHYKMEVNREQLNYPKSRQQVQREENSESKHGVRSGDESYSGPKTTVFEDEG
ncbi:hypothetical protein B0H13DRAFT_1904047 [Mycena leptocephala]|nr:hypothetical protein B0H13DRAFT_1904047 [Mycena leptocephala]